MRLLVFAIVLSSIGLTGAAQDSQDGPAFEVASVKINRSGPGPTSLGFQQQSGRFSAVNEPLWRLIAEAYRTTYQLRRFEIVGIPNAVDGERFDIEAIASPATAAGERPQMLQRLLRDRFKLTVHRESRELPIYHLVKLRADGRLGERLEPSPIDCSAIRAAGRPLPTVPEGQTRPCVMVFGQGTLKANGMRVTDLAEMGISRSVERLVVDRTGLTGGFDWTLEWTPDRAAVTPPGGAGANGVPIFTALQEQLGLKLEPARGPVPVVVVDHVELPAPD